MLRKTGAPPLYRRIIYILLICVTLGISIHFTYNEVEKSLITYFLEKILKSELSVKEASLGLSSLALRDIKDKERKIGSIEKAIIHFSWISILSNILDKQFTENIYNIETERSIINIKALTEKIKEISKKRSRKRSIINIYAKSLTIEHGNKSFTLEKASLELIIDDKIDIKANIKARYQRNHTIHSSINLKKDDHIIEGKISIKEDRTKDTLDIIISNKESKKPNISIDLKKRKTKINLLLTKKEWNILGINNIYRDIIKGTPISNILTTEQITPHININAIYDHINDKITYKAKGKISDKIKGEIKGEDNHFEYIAWKIEEDKWAHIKGSIANKNKLSLESYNNPYGLIIYLKSYINKNSICGTLYDTNINIYDIKASSKHGEIEANWKNEEWNASINLKKHTNNTSKRKIEGSININSKYNITSSNIEIKASSNNTEEIHIKAETNNKIWFIHKLEIPEINTYIEGNGKTEKNTTKAKISIKINEKTIPINLTIDHSAEKEAKIELSSKYKNILHKNHIKWDNKNILSTSTTKIKNNTIDTNLLISKRRLSFIVNSDKIKSYGNITREHRYISPYIKIKGIDYKAKIHGKINIEKNSLSPNIKFTIVSNQNQISGKIYGNIEKEEYKKNTITAAIASKENETKSTLIWIKNNDNIYGVLSSSNNDNQIIKTKFSKSKNQLLKFKGTYKDNRFKGEIKNNKDFTSLKIDSLDTNTLILSGNIHKNGPIKVNIDFNDENISYNGQWKLDGFDIDIPGKINTIGTLDIKISPYKITTHSTIDKININQNNIRGNIKTSWSLNNGTQWETSLNIRPQQTPALYFDLFAHANIDSFNLFPERFDLTLTPQLYNKTLTTLTGTIQRKPSELIAEAHNSQKSLSWNTYWNWKHNRGKMNLRLDKMPVQEKLSPLRGGKLSMNAYMNISKKKTNVHIQTLVLKGSTLNLGNNLHIPLEFSSSQPITYKNRQFHGSHLSGSIGSLRFDITKPIYTIPNNRSFIGTIEVKDAALAWNYGKKRQQVQLDDILFSYSDKNTSYIRIGKVAASFGEFGTFRGDNLSFTKKEKWSFRSKWSYHKDLLGEKANFPRININLDGNNQQFRGIISSNNAYWGSTLIDNTSMRISYNDQKLNIASAQGQFKINATKKTNQWYVDMVYNQNKNKTIHSYGTINNISQFPEKLNIRIDHDILWNQQKTISIPFGTINSHLQGMIRAKIRQRGSLAEPTWYGHILGTQLSIGFSNFHIGPIKNGSIYIDLDKQKPGGLIPITYWTAQLENLNPNNTTPLSGFGHLRYHGWDVDKLSLIADHDLMDTSLDIKQKIGIINYDGQADLLNGTLETNFEDISLSGCLRLHNGRISIAIDGEDKPTTTLSPPLPGIKIKKVTLVPGEKLFVQTSNTIVSLPQFDLFNLDIGAVKVAASTEKKGKICQLPSSQSPENKLVISGCLGHKQPCIIEGNVQSRHGYLNVYGNRFEISKARLIFDKINPKYPTLELRANFSQRGFGKFPVSILLDYRNTIDKILNPDNFWGSFSSSTITDIRSFLGFSRKKNTEKQYETPQAFSEQIEETPRHLVNYVTNAWLSHILEQSIQSLTGRFIDGVIIRSNVFGELLEQAIRSPNQQTPLLPTQNRGLFDQTQISFSFALPTYTENTSIRLEAGGVIQDNEYTELPIFRPTLGLVLSWDLSNTWLYKNIFYNEGEKRQINLYFDIGGHTRLSKANNILQRESIEEQSIERLGIELFANFNITY